MKVHNHDAAVHQVENETYQEPVTKSKAKVKFMYANDLNRTPAPKSITTYEPSQQNYPVPMTQQYRNSELNREVDKSPSLAEFSNERTKILIT